MADAVEEQRNVWRVPGIVAVNLATFFGACGFFALIAVAPLWAVHGGAGPGGAGLVNGALLIATVLTQFLVPALMDRWGTARVFAVGLALLGAPAPLLTLSDALPWILVCSAVRGVGFAVLTVGGSSAVAQLVPAGQRGRALGAWGLAIALPNLLLLPLSIPVAESAGFAVVFWLAALPLLGIPAALALGRHANLQRRTTRRGPLAARAMLSVLRPTTVLFAVTVGGGAVLTFVPQVAGAGVSALALLVLGGVAAGSRWLAGHFADRGHVQVALAPGLVVTAIGLGIVAWASTTPDTPAGKAGFLAAAGIIGLAYGTIQNLTMVAAFQRVDDDQVSMASAAWNVGFDLGTAVGSMAMGAVVGLTDYRIGFLVMGALALAALPAALPRRPHSR